MTIPDSSSDPIRIAVDAIYREQSRRVFATLVRLLGDLDLAEEALHDAFISAVKQWSETGIPANPRAWLVSAGRFKAIDAIRRRARFDASLEELANRVGQVSGSVVEANLDEDCVEDDRLRLIFTCCHPALPANAQIPLTLREVCGLTTEEIASAFLTSPSTIAQRIVRGKAKIRAAKIPYQLPSAEDLPSRLESVLAIIYLVYNEGYSASSGRAVTRSELSEEAIRLGRLLLELLPDAEVLGLLALMLIQESRRQARVNSQGDLILLEDQDRSLWNRSLIEEGKQLLARAFASESVGSYTLQAAIAAVHADAPTTAATDWRRIVALYDVMRQTHPSPIIELNRAVAIAMRDGPQAGLDVVESILQRGELEDYYLAHAARADLLRRLGRVETAVDAYRRALELTQQEPERRFLQRRLNELKGPE
jgi:RNA polymerase sigma-70 factor, ECF subfamily